MFGELNLKNLKLFLYKTFDIREGELRRVVLMQSSIFLLISTLLIIKPTINSLFLSEVGIESLPTAFILVAIAAGIITTFYSRVLNHLPLIKTIQFTLVFSVISISIFSILLRFNIIDTWILYLFYIWVAVFGVLATSQYWILANIIFNPREAKRLFSLIGGAAIAGGIFGGYLTSALAPVIGSENLLFVGVILLSVCIPLSKKIWYSNEATSSSVFRRKERMGKISDHPLRLILKSKHLTYLALITAISVLVSKLTEYQFSAISSERITDPDELTAFFGFWFSNINIISLLIQLFITRKVVGVYGVGISLFFLPAGIFIGALAVLIMPSLWSAILIKTSDGSLKQSINKSAIELLALPIPTETKNQVKTFIDVFIDSFATGLGGIILIMLINAFNLSIHFVSISIMLLILLWFHYAKKVRIEYLALFKEKLNLKNEPLKNNKTSLDLNNLSVYEGLCKVLSTGSTQQILFVLQHVDDIQNEKLFENIKNLLGNESPIVIAGAIRKLYFYRTENLSESIGRFTDHDSQMVKIAAIEYLIEHSAMDRSNIIGHYLNDSDYTISYATLLALINEIKDNHELKDKFDLKYIIETKFQEIIHEDETEETFVKKVMLLKAIGNSNIPQLYTHIHDAFNSTNPEVQKGAIRAAGYSLDEEFIPSIVGKLNSDANKKEAKEALAGYGFKILRVFHEFIKHNKIDATIVKELPEIAEKIGNQASVDFLFELLEYDDVLVRDEAIKSLTTIKMTKSHVVFNNKRIISHIFNEAYLYENTLSAMYLQQERMHLKSSSGYNEEFEARKSLIRLLEKKLDNNLDRIFKFLGLKYPTDEIFIVFKGLKSDKIEIRMNAIEFLDNLLETNLKKILIPIIETSIAETLTEKTLKDLRIKISSQYECFKMLLEGKDTKVKLAVLYLIAVLKDPKYIPLVRLYENHPNTKINTFAQNALKSIGSKIQ